MVSAMPVPQTAPWESAAPEEQLFVLITGANSGIGLGMCQRLIDEFLATRSLTSHLILMPTARASSKCADATNTLLEYAANAAQTSDALKARAGGEEHYDWKQAAARIHILSLPLELCDLRFIYDFADTLCNGVVSSPDGVAEESRLTNVRVPRIDSVVFNAGYGGWSGFNFFWAIWSLITLGVTESTTYPNFKTPLPTEILNEKSQYNYPLKPLLAEVFCAGVFGHYVLGHELLPLLSRRKDETVPPGRLIWTSSVEAHAQSFSITDIQSFTRSVAYESVKRLTDLVSLSATLPASQESVRSYLTIDNDSSSSDDTNGTDDSLIPPNIYLTHPGVAATTLFPVPWFLVWAYSLAVSLTRWIGSPWHLPSSYAAARAPAWVVMETQEHLDETKASRLKLGSACDVDLNEYVKATEVEGWGWTGEVENPADDTTPGSLNRNCGRKKGMGIVTEEEIVEFEREGAYCWAELEKLRVQWRDILADE